MSQRTRFVMLHGEGLATMVDLCRRFGISTKTGYKWLKRFQAGGLEALEERSRAPHTCPHRTSRGVEDALVAAREAHPHWGGKKLIPYLDRRQADPRLANPALVGVKLPPPSTASAILKRRGMVPEARRPRVKPPHPGHSPVLAAAPNQVWTADFKGEFLVGDRSYCYPLTVSDAHSRYLLACHGLQRAEQKGAFAVFEELFHTYGLPTGIRTDNGTPFATTAVCGLSRLSVWWTKLGIVHQRITPGRPQENGSHERMHRTLKKETTRPPEADLATQQAAFDRFRLTFNEERPHEALAMATPAMLYRSSSRLLPATVPEPVYPGYYELRKVGPNGDIRFKQGELFTSCVLAGELLGLAEVDEKVWAVYFCDLLLGHFREDERKLVGAI